MVRNSRGLRSTLSKGVPVKGGMTIDHPRYKKLIDPGTCIEPKNWWVGSMCFLQFFFFSGPIFGSVFFNLTYSRFARVSKKNLDST